MTWRWRLFRISLREKKEASRRRPSNAVERDSTLSDGLTEAARPTPETAARDVATRGGGGQNCVCGRRAAVGRPAAPAEGLQHGNTPRRAAGAQRLPPHQQRRTAFCFVSSFPRRSSLSCSRGGPRAGLAVRHDWKRS